MSNLNNPVGGKPPATNTAQPPATNPSNPAGNRPATVVPVQPPTPKPNNTVPIGGPAAGSEKNGLLDTDGAAQANKPDDVKAMDQARIEAAKKAAAEEAAKKAAAAEEAAKAEPAGPRKFRVKLQDNPELVVAGHDRLAAIEEYKKQCGIVNTIHTFSVSDVE